MVGEIQFRFWRNEIYGIRNLSGPHEVNFVLGPTCTVRWVMCAPCEERIEAQHAPKRIKGEYIKSACNQCRAKRIRCNGEQPCVNCIKRNLECAYREDKRRLKRSSVYLSTQATSEENDSLLDIQSGIVLPSVDDRVLIEPDRLEIFFEVIKYYVLIHLMEVRHSPSWPSCGSSQDCQDSRHPMASHMW